jgi:hypothetical protein
MPQHYLQGALSDLDAFLDEYDPDKKKGKDFGTWYADIARKTGINPDPDHPEHHYDYRAAYREGAEPQLGEDGQYHWPSKFKADDHPNRFVGGVDTRDQKSQPAVDQILNAIAHAEGTRGDYRARGGSGEYGKYQFMPETWNDWSQRYLGEVKDPTPENQDAVARSRVQDLLNKGHTAEQIASMWNSGSPDWEGKRGVNQHGIRYDVPAYVEKFREGLGAGGEEFDADSFLDQFEGEEGDEIDAFLNQQDQKEEMAETVKRAQLGLDQEDKTADMLRVAGAMAGGALAFIPAGLAGIHKIMETSHAGETDLQAASDAVENVLGIPMQLLSTSEQERALEMLTYPFQKIHESSRWWGDKMEKATGSPDAGALIATALEAATYLGLPALKAKLTGSIKARNLDKAMLEARDIHRKRLEQMNAEAKHGEPLLTRDPAEPLKADIPTTAGEFVTQITREEPALSKTLRTTPKIGEKGAPLEAIRAREAVNEYRRKKGLPPIETFNSKEFRTFQKERALEKINEFREKKGLDRFKSERGSFSLERLGTEPDHVAGPAIKMEDGRVITGRDLGVKAGTHAELYNRLPHDLRNKIADSEGFVTERGMYLTRKEAGARVANKSEAEAVKRPEEWQTADVLNRPLEKDAPPPRWRNQDGFIDLNAIKESINDLRERSSQHKELILSALDVEHPWKKIEAPETGFAIKNNFSTRTMWEEWGLERAANIAKAFERDRAIAPHVVLAAENPKTYLPTLPKDLRARVEPASKAMADFFKEAQKMYEDRGIHLDFKGRIQETISDQIKKTTDKAEIAALETALKQVEQMEFVHIPSAMWFESYFGKDPAGAKSVLRLMAGQKRKTFRIEDLVKDGIVKFEDLHPVDVIGSYSRRMGKDFATLDMIDAAIKEGMASKKPQAGFVKIPVREAPILKDYYVHPMLADVIHELTHVMNRGKLGQAYDWAMSGTKMMQFYNPLFLPMYDAVQQAMAMGYRTPKAWVKGGGELGRYISDSLRDVHKKTPEYWEALRNGLASKPFDMPFDTFLYQLEKLKMTRGEQAVKFATDLWPHHKIKELYNASWHVAWELDKAMRMATYKMFREQGMTAREAAQTAARFHGDYASVPVSTRRAANKLFFTPTFKIAMGKLYSDMLKGAMKTGGLLGKDVSTKALGRGIFNTFAITQGFDTLMTYGLGFERDQWGRRYTKRVEMEDGTQKDIVLTWSTPANMFLKYLYRAQEAYTTPYDTLPKAFLDSNKWEFHPVWRTIYEVTTNSGASGKQIYSPFDKDIVKIGKGMSYSIANIVRMLGMLDDSVSDPDARKKFAEETNKMLDIFSQPFVFKYLRTPPEIKAYHELRKLRQTLSEQVIRHALRKEGDRDVFTEEHAKVFLKQIQRVMAEFEKQQEKHEKRKKK